MPTESTVVISMLADALCTQTPYCWAMTKTLGAKRLDRLARDACDHEADKDQAEERNHESDDVAHVRRNEPGNCRYPALSRQPSARQARH